MKLVQFPNGKYGISGYDFGNNPIGVSYLDINWTMYRYNKALTFNPIWHSLNSPFFKDAQVDTIEQALKAVEVYKAHKAMVYGVRTLRKI